jgi:hypothetical protein
MIPCQAVRYDGVGAFPRGSQERCLLLHPVYCQIQPLSHQQSHFEEWTFLHIVSVGKGQGLSTITS